MKKISIDDAIKNAIGKYKILQSEDVYIEHYNGIIVLNWNSFMDGYINMLRVKQVAKFLRKYTDMPIYNAYGLMNV